jgi:hypothetical protein
MKLIENLYTDGWDIYKIGMNFIKLIESSSISPKLYFEKN